MDDNLYVLKQFSAKQDIDKLIFMDVSIVIVSYNTCNLTLQCLHSIYKETNGLGFEIIVVDNASSDDSVSCIRERYPAVVVIESKTNLGFGKANNLGAKIARGKYLFLLNSDTVLMDNAIFSLYKYMESLPEDSKIACCGTSLLDHNKKIANSGGCFPSLFQEFSDLGFRYLYPSFYRNKLAVNRTFSGITEVEVDYVIGADMFINKSVFDQLNGFDERFFMYYEETDFFFRFKEMRYRALIIPTLHIIHLEGASFKGKSQFKASRVEMFFKSKVLYYTKHKGHISTNIMKLLSLGGSLVRLYKYKSHIFQMMVIIIKS